MSVDSLTSVVQRAILLVHVRLPACLTALIF